MRLRFRRAFNMKSILSYCRPVKRKQANVLKHQTLPLMGATRLASVFQRPRPAALRQRLTDWRAIGTVSELSFSVCTLHFLREEAAEKCPTRDASPPLEVAFGA